MSKQRQPSNNPTRTWWLVFTITFGTLLISLILYHELAHDRTSSNTNPRQETNDKSLVKQTKTTDSQAPSIPVRSISFVDYMALKKNVLSFNRIKILPRIKNLVELDYFRYVKVNLNRPCKLWCNAAQCNRKDCEVKVESDPLKCPIATYNEELSTVNTEMASDQLDLLNKLFECDDSDDHNLQYVDLLINPERFTGYKGETATRVWRAIYEENCFIKKTRSPFNSELCYEERLFYQAISGLHSSINIHLCAEYPANELIGSDRFEPNLDEFLRRFTKHNDYLENLFTLFLLELRALSNSEPYLLKNVKWSEESTKEAVQDLLKVVSHIDIPKFQDLANDVSHELALRFRNITTNIIDCVACDKCKLWGKVQLRGLGTAFKILTVKDMRKLNLSQQEIVSLINAIARLSHSIRQLETFKQLMVEKRVIDFTR